MASLLSELSFEVFNCLVQDEQQCLPSFRGQRYFADQLLPAGELQSVDCDKQYSTAGYMVTHRWPQFSRLDCIERFDGRLTPGVYYVTRFGGSVDMTWEGPRWYPEPWVDYHLNETRWVQQGDITHAVRANWSYAPNMWRPLLDEL